MWSPCVHPLTQLTVIPITLKETTTKKDSCHVQMVHVLESELRNECIFDESLTVTQSDLSAMDPSSTNQKNLRTTKSRVPPCDNAKLHQSTMLRESISSDVEIFSCSLTRALFTHAPAPSCSPFPWSDSKKLQI